MFISDMWLIPVPTLGANILVIMKTLRVCTNKSPDNKKKRWATVLFIFINTVPTSLVSASFFLFSNPCAVPLTGAWWPGRPGTNTLLLVFTMGVFTWNRKLKIMFSSLVTSIGRNTPAQPLDVWSVWRDLDEVGNKYVRCVQLCWKLLEPLGCRLLQISMWSLRRFVVRCLSHWILWLAVC